MTSSAKSKLKATGQLIHDVYQRYLSDPGGHAAGIHPLTEIQVTALVTELVKIFNSNRVCPTNLPLSNVHGPLWCQIRERFIIDLCGAGRPIKLSKFQLTTESITSAVDRMMFDIWNSTGPAGETARAERIYASTFSLIGSITGTSSSQRVVGTAAAHESIPITSHTTPSAGSNHVKHLDKLIQELEYETKREKKLLKRRRKVETEMETERAAKKARNDQEEALLDKMDVARNKS